MHFWSRKVSETSELTLLHQSAVHIPQAVVQRVQSALTVVPVEVFVVRAVTVEVVKHWRHQDDEHHDAGPRLWQINSKKPFICLCKFKLNGDCLSL